MVFCCNSGDGEREFWKESKPVAVELSRSTYFRGCPRQNGMGAAGQRNRIDFAFTSGLRAQGEDHPARGSVAVCVGKAVLQSRQN